MGSYSKLQKEFAGAGKVHGTSEIMFKWNPADYKRILKIFDNFTNRTTVRKAIERAAVRAADEGVKLTKESIAEDTTLKPKEIGDRVKRYAHGSALGMAVGLKISDTARPLSDFAFTPKKPKPRTAPIIEIYKGQKKVLSKGAFVANMTRSGKDGIHAGHVGIYERNPDKKMKKYPNREALKFPFAGPSVTSIFQGNEQVHEMVWNAIFNKFEERIEHELDLILGGK